MSVNLEATIREKFEALAPAMNEAMTRLWAAAEARALGHGGIAVVARATGLARRTIAAGSSELSNPAQQARIAAGEIRRPGAGRPRASIKQPGLEAGLVRLLAPATRGDPQSPLLWTSKSKAKLAAELQSEGFAVSPNTVGALLRKLGYSLQAPRKTKEGGHHPDRDAQFQHIQALVAKMQADNQPVISVDCKKKELIGEFMNRGREWRPKGRPVSVNVYDFIDDALFKAIPYGVYDLTRDEGWVSIGITHETAMFAVDTIQQWWRHMGHLRYPAATEVLITADGGGSNGSRNRLWKQSLQKLADHTGLTIHVCHFPPGTSKWNKIEHRLFNHITMNWRGRPLTTLEAVVALVASTSTQTGLHVRAAQNRKSYPTGIKVTDDDYRHIHLVRDSFHGEWNYSIESRQVG